MKGKILFLIALLVLAILIAGCGERAGEPIKKLAPVVKSPAMTSPIAKTESVKSCSPGIYTYCADNNVLNVSRSADCNDAVLSKIPCGTRSCTETTVPPSCR